MFLTISRKACAQHPGGQWTFGVERVGFVPKHPNLVYFTASSLQGRDAKPEMDFVDSPNEGDHYLARDYDGNVVFEHRAI